MFLLACYFFNMKYFWLWIQYYVLYNDLNRLLINFKEFLNSLEMDPKVVNSNSKYSLAKDSIEIFNTSSNYKPSTTKPAQQQQQRKTSSHQISANVASSTFLPKYSSAEPRASSSSASLNNSSSPTNDLSTTSQMLKK